MKKQLIKSLFVLMMPLSLAACGGGGSSSVTTAQAYNVTYTIDGTASSAVVTYQNGGSTSQEAITLPWQKQLFLVQPGAFLYVSAQNQTASSTVNAKISINGSLWQMGTTNAAFGIATASGSCCQ